MNELEEIEFVESPFEYKLLNPLFSIDFEGTWQERLITDTALVPLYLSKEIPEEYGESLTSIEIIDRVSTFFDRTQFYHMLFNQWMDWLESETGPGYLTKRTAIYAFAPLFVQELEGPHRYQLAALIDLCKSIQGESENWEDRLYHPNGDMKYFSTLQMETIDILKKMQDTGDTKDLNDAYDYLLNALVLLAQHEKSGEEINLKGMDSTINEALNISDHPNAGSVRNSIAHSDFHFDFSEVGGGNYPPIVYNIDGNEYRLNLDGVILFINYQMSLLRALSTGITLAVFHQCVEHDIDEGIQKIAIAAGVQDLTDLF